MTLPRNLTDEAAASLVGTPWSQIDGQKFHGAALALARSIATAGRAWLAGLARRPDNVSGGDARSRTDAIIEDVKRLGVMLEACRAYGNPAASADVLARFANEGSQTPQEAAPEAFISRIFFDVTREIYPFFRLVIVTYVDPVRRRGWGAWCPSDVVTGDVPPPPLSVIDDTQIFELYHWPLMMCAFSGLGHLGSGCRPSMRRVAEDVVFMDAVALTIASVPTIRRGFCETRELLTWDDKDLCLLFMAAQDMSQLLPLIANENRKPWSAHSISFVHRGQTQPASAALTILAGVLSKMPDVDSDMASRDYLGARMALDFIFFYVEGLLRMKFFEIDSHEIIISHWNWLKEQRQKMEPFADRCDWCSQEASQGELRRCSKCVFARYCSKEHQVAGWKGRSKEDGSQIWLPHKDICVDAKKAGWMPGN